MGRPPAPTAHKPMAPWWPGAEALGAPPRHQRHFLRQQDRMPMARDAHGYRQWAYDLWLLQRRASRGGWTRVMETLRQWERQSQGRLLAPSLCCANSQSIKAAPQGTDIGFDGNKKVHARK